MAYNYTEHLGLSLWAANDPLLRSEFNTDHKIIDSALQQLHYAHGCTTGTYQGGEVPDRVTIDVGFQPTLALILCEHPDTSHASDVMCLLAVPGAVLRIKRSGGNRVRFETVLTATGLDMAERSNDQYGLNVPGLTYHYAMFH